MQPGEGEPLMGDHQGSPLRVFRFAVGASFVAARLQGLSLWSLCAGYVAEARAAEALLAAVLR